MLAGGRNDIQGRNEVVKDTLAFVSAGTMRSHASVAPNKFLATGPTCKAAQGPAADFIYPLFVMESEGRKEAIPSMPDCYRYSLDLLLEEAKAARDLGIGVILRRRGYAIALFPLISGEQKDNADTESDNPDGLIPRAVRSLKQAVPELLVITDVALDPYSSEGHDGIVEYVIYDTDAAQVTLREVTYDYQKTCEAIVEKGLPPIFAWRLAKEMEFAERADDPSHVCER